MTENENYEMKDVYDKKLVSSGVTQPEDDENYKKVALLDALISVNYSYKSEVFGKLVVEYMPDIDYVIPPSGIFKLDEPSYRAGNTILHVAKELHEQDFCEAFIYNGADFTLKNNNGSPLISLNAEKEYRNYFDFKTGKENSDKGFIDLVLSAHIQFENTCNPSDKHGFSHFHAACMFNKLELVKLFLENGVSVHDNVNSDSPIYAGFTPLHLAAKYCAVETVELLLNYDADAQIKNSEGLNPLHLLIDEKLNTWAQLTRRVIAHVKDDQEFSFSSLEMFHNKIEKLITLLLERRNTECGFGVYDDTALSYLHVICTMQDTSIVARFLHENQVDLEQKVNENSALWPGFTALHFAAHFNPETVKLLLRRGANLGAKDAKGMTPFDICLHIMTLTDIHSIYSLYPPWSNIQFSDEKTRLSDFLRIMQETDIVKALLDHHVTDMNMHIPFDSPICPGYTPLHLNVICSEMPRNWNLKNVDQPLTIPKERLHWKRIMECVMQGANVFAKDARGATPIHLAFNLQRAEIINILVNLSMMHQPERLPNVVDEDGLSTLHIVCAAELFNSVAKLLSDGANVNQVTKASYIWTEAEFPLGPETLWDSGSELYTTIPKGSTPLHVVAVVGCSIVIDLLPACGADVLAKDVDGMTPLERCLGTPIFEKTEKVGYDFRCKPMFDKKKEVLEALILLMSDLMADERSDRMMYCYSLLSDELLSRVLENDYDSVMKILKSAGITKLHVACFTKDLQKISELFENGTDVNARVDLTSPLWPGCTPLHILMKRHDHDWINDEKPEHVEIARLLLTNGADVAARDAIDNTPLHQMFQSYLNCHDNALFVDMLLDHITDFSINPVNPKGLSHLHAACVRNKTPLVEKFLENGAEIDQAVDYFDHNYGGFTSLHLAAAYQSEKAVDILLKHGADIHRKDVFEGNLLHAATFRKLRQPCDGMLRILISAGADVNNRNVFGKRPLEKLLESAVISKEEVEVLLERGCSVNEWDPVIDEGCLATALKIHSNDTPIFQTITTALDIKSIDGEGRNAMHNIVSYSPDWEVYDDGEPIEEIFISVENYVAAIEILVNLGVDIDHQDNQGKTPLHTAAQRQNITAVVGLLNNGANINIVDHDGKTAFAHSLNSSKIKNHVEQLDSRILALISMHMYKLKLIGHELSRFNLEVWQEIRKTVSIDNTWHQECLLEFEMMKSRDIAVDSITLSDFLPDTGAVSYYPHVLPEKRTAIDGFFECKADELRKEFPELTNLLLVQYRKAKARLHLIEPAEASFYSLVDYPVDSVCTRIILRFLSNYDLKNLIASMNT